MSSPLDRFRPDTAWRAYYPTGTNPWDVRRVAHLYRRTTGGATWAQLESGLQATPSELAAALVAGQGATAEARFNGEMAGVASRVDTIETLQAYVLHRLMHSPHPFRERMTLFWHNHFATSNAKIRNVRLMQIQYETLHRHALGRFDALLQDLTFDPAMIVWLDGNANKAGKPNENYAREVMELFSLGVGNYTEKDIQEAARALTGWSVEGAQAKFNPAEHDSGEKTIFGQTGHWTAGDVVRLCLCQPACATFMVRKLYRFLVSETAEPSAALLKPLEDGFRARNYDIAWLAGQMLQSWVFFSDAAIGQIVKSPVDYATGVMIALEGRPNLRELATLGQTLGQNLFSPPSVKGWDGGVAWINSATLLRRQNMAFDVTLGQQGIYRTDPARLASRHELSSDEALVTFFLRLFHQQTESTAVQSIVAQLQAERGSAAFPTDPDAVALNARSAAHLALVMPEFQLG